MLTITNARTQHGWDSRDHLIDDSRLAEIIGRSYATLEHARRAAVARSDGYVTIEYMLGGRHYRYDGSPTVPGRDVVRVRDITSEAA